MERIWQAMVLGIVQGISEFLPISSTAHLALVPWLFGWDTELLHSLTYGVALHVGTVLAVLWYFRQDWRRLVSGFLGSLTSRSLRGDPWRKLSWLVMVATIPGGVIGFLFEDAVETTLRSPYVMGSALILFSVVMAIAERMGSKVRKIESIRIGDAVLIGFGQAIALIPGISRSGSTISAGLLVGLTRETAARFSFLLSTPIVLGAVAKKTLDLRHAAVTGDDLLLMAIGVLFAAIAGYLSIKWLLIFLGRAPLYAFVWYRVVVGLVVIALASSQALT